MRKDAADMLQQTPPVALLHPLTINDIDHNAGRFSRGRHARIVARIQQLRIRNPQSATDIKAKIKAIVCVVAAAAEPSASSRGQSHLPHGFNFIDQSSECRACY